MSRPFPYGYGLSLDESKSDHMGIDASDFELDGEAFACGDVADGGPASEDQILFGRLADDEFKMYISATQTVGRESRPAAGLAPLFPVSAPTQ